MAVVVKGLVKTPYGFAEAKDLKAGDAVIDMTGAAVPLSGAEETETGAAVTFKRRPSVVLGADAVLVTVMGDRSADDGKGAPVYMRLPNGTSVADEMVTEEKRVSGVELKGSEEGQTVFVGDYCVRC